MAASQRLPRYLRVTALLRTAVQSGVFGDKLPAENDLATRYRISRMTLRRAVAALAEEGLLDPRHGAGTFVREGAAQARIVALVVAPDMAKQLADLFHQQLVLSLMYGCTARGWMLRVAPSAEDLGARLGAGRGASVSGCIAIAFGAQDQHLLSAIPIPVICVDGEPMPGSSSVLPDNHGGTMAAIARLVALGHRRIAHLTGSTDKLDGRERLQAYRTAMAQAGLAVGDDDVIPGRFLLEDGYAAMERWWRSPARPTAVFCANDMMAIGAVRWASEHGVRVGSDVSIIGCDGLSVSALVWPSITTLALDFAVHADNVLDAVADSDRGGIRRTPLRLVERDSIGPPRQ